jgi:NADP-dependent 3-hydroxy acid dehydrogenase YdfG
MAVKKQSSGLAGRIAAVTGASGGIGRAIAIALAAEGACVYASGRDRGALAQTVSTAKEYSRCIGIRSDLTSEEGLQEFTNALEAAGTVDILIHSAGLIQQTDMEHGRIQDLDVQYSVNVRTPYLLTQRLLPQLISSRGQIVFINSSVGLTAKRAEIGQYAATKHALKAIADSLREEVNPKGVRVLTLYLGRTATPMQKTLAMAEGKAYCPDILLQPEDVASTIIHALRLPATAEITDINIRPMRKS